MKSYTKYICAVVLMLGMSVSAWGTTESITFATCEWGFPAGSASFGYFSYDGYHIYAEGIKVGYLNPNYYGVILDKNQSAHIQLPAIPGTISSIEVTAYSGASPSANLSLYVDGVIVGSAKNIGTTSASWTGLSIPANAVVKLQNDDDSNGKMTQITGVIITHNGSQVGGSSGSIPDGSYAVEAMPAVRGQGTATSSVAYSEGAETVTFTATPASGYSFDRWEITYVSSCTYSDLANYYWIDDDNDATCRITMPYGKVTAVAYFAEASCTSNTVYVFDGSGEDEQIEYYGTLTSFDLTYLSDGLGAVTWSSTNTDVATVVGDGGDGATVTVVGAGSANIVATVAEDATYCEGVGVYELTIEEIAPTVTNFTASCTNNTITVANDNASMVSNNGGLSITRYGYLYSTSVSTPTFGASGVNDAYVGTSDVTLNARWAAKEISGLSAGTTYYVRAYACNGTQYGYSSVVTITTKCAVTYAANGGSGTTTDTSSPYTKLSDVTVLANNFYAPENKVFDYWSGSDGNDYHPGDIIEDISTDITLTAQWRNVTFTDAKFSCADWTLTGPSGDIVFITSAASKTVRSQEAFHVSGSGLPHSTALTFTISPASVSSKFAIKKADGTIPSTDAYGKVEADVYVFYTPGSGDTSDGLDEFSNLTVSVEGEPRSATITSKRVIGRHLPAEFVIAAKKNGKWWALPDTMTSVGTPKPIEIAVNDINNPSLAYTTVDTKYSLEGPAASNISGGVGQYVKLVMNSLWSDDSNHLKGHAPLFGSATKTAKIGKSGDAQATNPLSKGWWWQLIQKNTEITNPQDAKYQIYCANNDTTLSLKENAGNPIWGLYKSGIDELRLIPASDVIPTEAYFVEWAQHGGVIEVDAEGVDATSVVAHLGEATSSAITLVQTKANDAKNKSSKYNYTVNFGDAIDFADAASNGAMLTLEWKNGETVKAMSNVVVPKIIAASATMKSIIATDDPWSKAEVHVLPGVTLEANAGDFSSKDVVINQLEIYPGATVKVTKGAQDVGTLKVKTLVLRNGWTRVGSKNYDVARLYVATDANLAQNALTDVWYSDWYIDYDQYYPIAVPFPVATSGMSYKNTNSEASAGVKLRYYSGELRATNIQQNQDANWVEYTWGGTMPANLEPSHGYIMTARRPSGKAFSIVRMPMTFSNEWTTAGEKGEVSGTHKDQVTVTAWGVKEGSETPYAEGWNMIANPYMALHEGELSYNDETDDVIQYANIPDISFKEYDQLPIETTKLKPSSAFLIQAPKTGTVTFGAANRKASAPSFRREVQDEVLPTQKAYILLASDEAEDMMGILVSDKYSAEFEINADLEKLMGDGSSLRTYMHFNEMKMAYLAINQELAEQLIPVSVRITNAGEHTFSMHSASKVGELEGVYLTDYLTGEVTNLLEESYPFSSEAGTISGRFAINAKVGERQTPTDLDIVDGDIHGNQPVKFIYRDKVYIWHNGVIYDATGKKVREINK